MPPLPSPPPSPRRKDTTAPKILRDRLHLQERRTEWDIREKKDSERKAGMSKEELEADAIQAYNNFLWAVSYREKRDKEDAAKKLARLEEARASGPEALAKHLEEEANEEAYIRASNEAMERDCKRSPWVLMGGTARNEGEGRAAA